METIKNAANYVSDKAQSKCLTTFSHYQHSAVLEKDRSTNHISHQ
jgi:hypothetical protein